MLTLLDSAKEDTPHVAPPANKRRLARLGLIVGVIYSISIWKFIKRDPLNGALGLEAVFEIGSVVLAFFIALLMARYARRRFQPQLGIVYIATFGMLTLASAYRSFSPSLSITKTMIFFAVLAVAWMMAQMGLTRQFLNGIYAGYITVSLLGVVVALSFPSRYPLILSEEWTHRNRLALFDMHPNSLAETSALMFLLGRILGGRYRWIPQVGLICLNLFAGEKTASAALIAIGIAAYVLERQWSVKQRTVAAVLLSWLLVGVFLSTTEVVRVAPSNYVAAAASKVYGDKVEHELSTLDGRAEVWKKAGELAADGIVIGYGFEGAREALLKAVYWSGQAHNGFLELILDGGVLGALFFTLGWVRITVTGLHGTRPGNVRAGALHCMILILSAIGPIFTYYSFFAEILAISLAYLALKPSPLRTAVPPREAAVLSFPEVPKASPLSSWGAGFSRDGQRSYRE